MRNELEMVKRLLNLGAIINMKGYRGISALKYGIS